MPVGFPRWPAAIRAIAAHPLYDGLVLEPQMGLVPLGPDPVSTLWEFTVLHTGEIPGRGPGERLETTASGAIVVVLLGR